MSNFFKGVFSVSAQDLGKQAAISLVFLGVVTVGGYLLKRKFNNKDDLT